MRCRFNRVVVAMRWVKRDMGDNKRRHPSSTLINNNNNIEPNHRTIASPCLLLQRHRLNLCLVHRCKYTRSSNCNKRNNT